MKKIIEGIKYWGQLLLLPIYWFSFLFPRNERIWLFGSTFGRRFADNPRYFYLYISQMIKNTELADHPCQIKGKIIRPIWISHKKDLVKFLNEQGYEAYYYHSVKGIWYCLRGKIYIFDNYSKDISFWLSGGAKKINMWHGIPLKKIQADNVFDKIRNPENGWKRFCAIPRRLSDEKPSHYVLTTSEFMKPIFESAFQTKNVLTIGYPRIDVLAFGEIQNLYTRQEQLVVDKIQNQMGEMEDGKMIYYMPTFRNSEKRFFEVMKLEEFREFLQENHFLFCVKLHPKSKLRKEFGEMEGGNIINIDADTDPHVFMRMADVLVTDYSSSYFDYLFTGKPVVYFSYDLDNYLSDSRELYFDYEEFTPGKKAMNQKQLQDVLLELKQGKDSYKEERKELQKKIFDTTDCAVSGMLVEEILKEL